VWRWNSLWISGLQQRLLDRFPSPRRLQDARRPTTTSISIATYQADGGNRTIAAEELGIHRVTLFRKVKKFNQTSD
jgi:transcriptional regulator of acetoin/glycerol metabolism